MRDAGYSASLLYEILVGNMKTPPRIFHQEQENPGRDSPSAEKAKPPLPNFILLL